MEDTGRPAILVAINDGEGKGSGRSIPAFDLHSALGATRDLLTRFGGHRAAAGITIAPENIEVFARRFNEVARERLQPSDLVPDLRIDLELPIDEVTMELESLLRHFEPFGMGNPSPLLASRRVRLAAPPRTIGQDGLKLRLATTAGELEAIGWGMADRCAELEMSTPLDIVYKLERDSYQGVSRLQARLIDIRR